MRNPLALAHPARTRNVPRSVSASIIAGLGLLTIFGGIGPAWARQYGASDVGYLINLWNTDRQRFKGTVQGIDTFFALGTVKSISATPAGGGFDVVIEVGLNARIECMTESAAVAQGDAVTVNGRIATAASAVSQTAVNRDAGAAPSDRARDTLGLQSCIVQQAFRSTKK